MGNADFNPGAWKGHDFAAARRAYDTHVGRSYSDARAAGVKAADLVPESISTDSPQPLIVVTDETGSMGDWTAVIFSKLGYLEIEGKSYLGEEMEISFFAIGDAYSDSYPLQVRPFTKGTDLATQLEQLKIESNGGGQRQETYELAALYIARNVHMPKALRPIVIFIGDEMPYPFVNGDHAKKYGHVDLPGRLSTKEVFTELARKCAVYVIKKPFDTSRSDSDQMKALENRMFDYWADLVGYDHIAVLPDPERVVDVIFGILAEATSMRHHFKIEIEGRQRPDQVATVYTALAGIHKMLPGDEDDEDKHKPLGNSRLLGAGDGERSKPLI